MFKNHFFPRSSHVWVYIFHKIVNRVSVWSGSKNRSLPLTTPINMTSRKHIGIINHSVTCFKILSFSSRWQHGLPLIPFIQIPLHLSMPASYMGHYILRLKCLMKNRKWSEDSARQALFLMNHCYVGGVVSWWNETVRYFHSVSSRAIDSCLFSQIDCRCWCNESILASVKNKNRITLKQRSYAEMI